jgi:hypothetical protein
MTFKKISKQELLNTLKYMIVCINIDESSEGRIEYTFNSDELTPKDLKENKVLVNISFKTGESPQDCKIITGEQ